MQSLTEKEIQIARFAAEGMTAQETADTMCLSIETIRWYRKRMLRKVDAKNFSELIASLKDGGII